MSSVILPDEPVFAQANHAAVVLVAPSLVEHARVDDVSYRNIQVIRAQLLEQLQGLVPRRLEGQGMEKQQILNQHQD